MLKLFTRSPWAELALIYCAAVWGSTFFLVKDSLASIDPYALVAWRFLSAAGLMAIPLVLRGLPLFANFRKGLVLGVMLGLLYILQTVGLGHTSASNSGFITGTFIVWVPLLNILCFGRRSPWPRLLAVGLALGGLWLLTGGIQLVNYGDVLTMCCAVVYASHVLYADIYVNADTTQPARQRLNLYVLNFQQLLVTGVIALAGGLLLGRDFGIVSLPLAGTLLFLTLVPTLSAFMLQLTAQQGVGPVATALIFCLEPVFAAIFAWSLGGEEMVPMRAVGGLLIVLAMIVSELPIERWLKRSAAADSPVAQ